jgi:hypothetical protein
MRSASVAPGVDSDFAPAAALAAALVEIGPGKRSAS